MPINFNLYLLFFIIFRVLEQTDAFNQTEARNIVTKLANHNICIGVKKLLGLLDMCKQMVITWKILSNCIIQSEKLWFDNISFQTVPKLILGYFLNRVNKLEGLSSFPNWRKKDLPHLLLNKVFKTRQKREKIVKLLLMKILKSRT